jgi:WD40 repeat protein
VAGLAFSPSGQALASFALGDFTPTIWDLTEPAEPLSPSRSQPVGHKNPVRALAFSPDAKTLATAANDSTIRLWDLTAKGFPEVARRTGHAGHVLALAFSPDGRTLASSSADQTVRLWEGGRLGLRSERLQLPNPHQKSTVCLEYSPDGRILVVAGMAEPGGPSLWACDVSASPVRRLWDIPGRRVNAITFSPDGKCLAVACGNGEIIVADAADGRRLRQWHRPGGISSLEFAPDGRHLAAANANGSVSILRLETFQ